jgi:hypothetical protein
MVVPVVVDAEGGQFARMEDAQLSGRVFYCHPWMVVQAQNFVNLIRVLGDEIELQVHGDGLLAHILNVGAAAYTGGDPALLELPA